MKYSDSDNSHKEGLGAPRTALKIEGASAVDETGEVHFNNINLAAGGGDHIAIVGDRDRANTALLMLLASSETNESYVLRRHPNARVIYVPQRIEDIDDMMPNKTVRDIFYDARGLTQIEQRLSFLYGAVADNLDRYSDELGELLVRFESLGGYGSADSEISQLISGLNVNVNEHDDIDIDSLPARASSGQKKKLLLARALFSKPDFLLLDNPSAHLDAEAQAWLGSFIDSTETTVLTTGGGAQFIERFATRIMRISSSGELIEKHTRSIEDFQEYYEGLSASITSKRQHVQSEIDRLTETKNRLAGWASKSGAVARKAAVMAERVTRASDQLNTVTELDTKINSMFVPFEAETMTGDVALKISSLQVGYESQESIVSIDEITIESGTRLRIVGRNGSGKSTLIKGMIQALYKRPSGDLSLSGSVVAAPKAVIGIFTPEQEVLYDNLSDSIYDAVSRETSNAGRLLKYWGFDPKQSRVQKVSSIKTAEEVSRYNLMLLMAKRPNILILDEPTGNLTDMYKNRLIKSLQAYSGTLIYISHDPDYNQEVKPDLLLKMPEGRLSYE